MIERITREQQLMQIAAAQQTAQQTVQQTPQKTQAREEAKQSKEPEKPAKKEKRSPEFIAQQKRINKLLWRAGKRGYIIGEDFRKWLWQQDLEYLQALDPDTIYEKLGYERRPSGDLIKGDVRRAEERSEAAKKGYQTRMMREAYRQQMEEEEAARRAAEQAAEDEYWQHIEEEEQRRHTEFLEWQQQVQEANDREWEALEREFEEESKDYEFYKALFDMMKSSGAIPDDDLYQKIYGKDWMKYKQRDIDEVNRLEEEARKERELNYIYDTFDAGEERINALQKEIDKVGGPGADTIGRILRSAIDKFGMNAIAWIMGKYSEEEYAALQKALYYHHGGKAWWNPLDKSPTKSESAATFRGFAEFLKGSYLSMKESKELDRAIRISMDRFVY